MIAGYLRKYENPGNMAKLIAIMCRYEGINLIYMNPDSILTNSNKVKGKMLIGKKWTDVEVDIPKYIDIAPTLFNNKKLKEKLDYLKGNSTLSVDKRMPLPKDKIQPLFKNDQEVKKYLIPTINIKSFDDIKDFLTKHEKIVLKPVRSNRGKNVILLRREHENYIIGMKMEERYYPEREFQKFYDENIIGNDFIAQKYIASKDMHGNPFDCRVHVEKNGKGEWRTAKNFIRIGIGQKVVSNVSQGGGVSDIKKFLITNYGENKGELILQDVRRFAKVLPYKVERVLNREYMTLGFDVGIDKDGNLYIFEVNDFPIVSPMKSEVAMLRAAYYRFMLEKVHNSK